MKKAPFYLCIFLCFFSFFACFNQKEKFLDKNNIFSILKNILIVENVEINTTTIFSINNIETTLNEKDIYCDNKYYHYSENSTIITQTWYGYVSGTLYAFYYLKEKNNQEIKKSSRIDESLLFSTKRRPNMILSNLFNNDKTSFLENHLVSGTKKGKFYFIRILTLDDFLKKKFCHC